MKHEETIKGAIMFTDIKDFTLKTSLLTQIQIDSLLNDHNNILESIITKYFGKVIKTIGDSYMVVYESVDNAINASAEIQLKLHEYNAKRNLPLYQIEIRIAIDYGTLNRKETTQGEDYFGDPVNLASRMEASVIAGRVFISQNSLNQIDTCTYPTRLIGKINYKGIIYDTEIYDIIFKKDELLLHEAGKLVDIDLETYKNSHIVINSKQIDAMIFNHASVAAILSIQPVPFFDIYSIVPLHIYMLNEISKKYGKKLTHAESKEILSTLLSSLGITYGASHGIVGLTKIGLVGVGGYLLIPFNFGFTYGFGKILSLYFYHHSKGIKLNDHELKEMFKFSKKRGIQIGKKDKKKILEAGKKYKDEFVKTIQKYTRIKK